MDNVDDEKEKQRQETERRLFAGLMRTKSLPMASEATPQDPPLAIYLVAAATPAELRRENS